jgi:hypothetical protein
MLRIIRNNNKDVSLRNESVHIEAGINQRPANYIQIFLVFLCLKANTEMKIPLASRLQRRVVR